MLHTCALCLLLLLQADGCWRCCNLGYQHRWGCDSYCRSGKPLAPRHALRVCQDLPVLRRPDAQRLDGGSLQAAQGVLVHLVLAQPDHAWADGVSLACCRYVLIRERVPLDGKAGQQCLPLGAAHWPPARVRWLLEAL